MGVGGGGGSLFFALGRGGRGGGFRGRGGGEYATCTTKNSLGNSGSLLRCDGFIVFFVLFY